MYCGTCNTSHGSGFPTGSNGMQWNTSTGEGTLYCNNCQSTLETYNR